MRALSAQVDDPQGLKNLDEIHISEQWLQRSTDEDLTGTITHEASHIYANTADNKYNIPYDPPAFERLGAFSSSNPTKARQMSSKPSPTMGHPPASDFGDSNGYTFTKAVNNASTLEYATQVLASVPPFDSDNQSDEVSFLDLPR
ncbi:hypothetical protein GCM10010872_10710 [Dyella flava]|nr:hypothetical protein GCM10010872_10710 [Dyella flava]